MSTDESPTRNDSGKGSFWVTVVIVVFVLVVGWDLTGWDFYGNLVGRIFLAPTAMLIGIPALSYLIVRSLNGSIAIGRHYPSVFAVLFAGLLIVLLSTAKTAIIDSRDYRINNCWVIEGSDDSSVSGSSRWVCAPGSIPYTWSGYDKEAEEGSSRTCFQITTEPNLWACETDNF